MLRSLFSQICLLILLALSNKLVFLPVPNLRFSLIRRKSSANTLFKKHHDE